LRWCNAELRSGRTVRNRFGAANTGGTGSSGAALARLSNQSIRAGGHFTVVAIGSATSSTLFLLDNNRTGTLATNPRCT
jgi:hypothetical protein